MKRLQRRSRAAAIKACSPHDLRRSFVSTALEGGPISRWCNGSPAIRRRSPPRGMTVARSTPRLRPPVSCTSRSPGRPRERKCPEHPPAGPASIPEIAVRGPRVRRKCYALRRWSACQIPRCVRKDQFATVTLAGGPALPPVLSRLHCPTYRVPPFRGVPPLSFSSLRSTDRDGTAANAVRGRFRRGVCCV